MQKNGWIFKVSLPSSSYLALGHYYWLLRKSNLPFRISWPLVINIRKLRSCWLSRCCLRWKGWGASVSILNSLWTNEGRQRELLEEGWLRKRRWHWEWCWQWWWASVWEVINKLSGGKVWNGCTATYKQLINLNHVIRERSFMVKTILSNLSNDFIRQNRFARKPRFFSDLNSFKKWLLTQFVRRLLRITERRYWSIGKSKRNSRIVIISDFLEISVSHFESLFLPVRIKLKESSVSFDKSEDALKAFQSVGQIIGEILQQLTEHKCECFSF